MHSSHSIAWLPLLAVCAGCAASDPPVPTTHIVGNNQRSAMLARLGDDMRRNGDPASALGIYLAASAADPANVGVLQRMGAAFLAMNDAPRAEQAFRGALSSEPGDRTAQQGLALSLLAQGRPAEALPILQKLAAGSSDPRLLRAEGVALDMVGRPNEAQAVYRQALRLNPIDADLHGNLALSLALSGDAADAMTEMQAAIAAPEPDPRQNANSVLVLALTGNDDAARVRGDATVGPAATEVLLARAQQAAAATDPRARAMAIGLLTGNGAGQPLSSTLLPTPAALTAPPGPETAAAPAMAPPPMPAPPQTPSGPLLSGSPAAAR